MARANLLSARALSFLELIGNGREFEVPKYQRDYSWTEVQWEELWEDVEQMLGQPDAQHYLGTIVLRATSDRRYEIIDGQQRLATLSVLGLAIINRLNALAAAGVQPDANRERAGILRNRFVGEKDPASFVEISKLRLNATNDGFFRDYLVQLAEPTNLRGEKYSNRLLWGCLQWFGKRLEQDSRLAQGEQLVHLLMETVARQLRFIEISVDDEVNAYTVFETLNARGLELSTTDLMKNYLFSRVRSQGDLDALERRWQTLMAKVRAEKFPEFLRFHYLCEFPQVRSERLYKLVRDRIRDTRDTFELLRMLEARAEIYSAIFDPGHEFWRDQRDARTSIEELAMFGTRAMSPVLIAGWEKLDKGAEYSRLLRMISILMFRFVVVGRLNTHPLEPASHRAARALLENRARTAGQVFEVLADAYVGDEKFHADFSTLELVTEGRGKKIARYILAMLESDASGTNCDHRSDDFTIEHILPENPGDEWPDWEPGDRLLGATNRLGNLVPLEPGLNREVGNSGLGRKLACYAKSRYSLARNVASSGGSVWDLEAIGRRQEQLARRAVHVWRSPYA